MGIPPWCTWFLRPSVPHRTDLLQSACWEGTQVYAALLAGKRWRVQALRWWWLSPKFHPAALLELPLWYSTWGAAPVLRRRRRASHGCLRGVQFLPRSVRPTKLRTRVSVQRTLPASRFSARLVTTYFSLIFLFITNSELTFFDVRSLHRCL